MGERQRFSLEEEDLYDVLSASDAAFAQLKGSIGELSNIEAALIIPRVIPSRDKKEKPKKVAHVLFLRGDSQEEGLDSVMGVKVFLNQLNDRLEATASEYQRMVLFSFDDHIRRGELSFDFPLRYAMVKAAILAVAGKYEITKDDGYKKQLEQVLPNLRRDAIGLVIHALYRVLRLKHPADTRVLEDMVQGLILTKPGEARQRQLAGKKEHQGRNEVLGRLKTERIRLMREQFGNPGIMTHKQFFTYVQAVFNIALEP